VVRQTTCNPLYQGFAGVISSFFASRMIDIPEIFPRYPGYVSEISRLLLEAGYPGNNNMIPIN
jgi:hypothetical protein